MENNTKEALIIFAKNPSAGYVKTRLAADMGMDKAFEIYLKLLYCTYKNTRDLNCDKFLYLSDFKDEDLFDENYRKEIQQGNNLGEKMKNAFNDLLGAGYDKIIIIGTDCPDADKEILNEAFEKLDVYDYILGPANDGGYYLLGLKESAEYLFENIEWSTEEVLKLTLDKIKEAGKKYFLLKELIDIDNISDLEKSGFK